MQGRRDQHESSQFARNYSSQGQPGGRPNRFGGSYFEEQAGYPPQHSWQEGHGQDYGHDLQQQNYREPMNEGVNQSQRGSYQYGPGSGLEYQGAYGSTQGSGHPGSYGYQGSQGSYGYQGSQGSYRPQGSQGYQGSSNYPSSQHYQNYQGSRGSSYPGSYGYNEMQGYDDRNRTSSYDRGYGTELGASNFGPSYGSSWGSTSSGPESFQSYGYGSQQPSTQRYGSQMGGQGQWSGQGTFGPYGTSGHQQMGQRTGKGPKGYRRSDERIREDVCEALSTNPQVDASEIEVNVSEGIVTLTGSIDSRPAKRHVEELIENMSGVQDVKNELKVEKKSSGTGDVTTHEASSRTNGQGKSSQDGKQSQQGRGTPSSTSTGGKSNPQ